MRRAAVPCENADPQNHAVHFKVLKQVMATADEPTVVADVVLEAAIADRPKLRYAAGGLAKRLRLLRRFAPAGLVDRGIRKDLRLDAVTASPRTQGTRRAT